MLKTQKKQEKEGRAREEVLRLKREREQIRRNKIKNYPQKYEICRQREKERYLKRKQEGKIKSIKELTEIETRQKRKRWNINNRTINKQEKTIRRTTKKIIYRNTPNYNNYPNTPPKITSNKNMCQEKRKTLLHRKKLHDRILSLKGFKQI